MFKMIRAAILVAMLGVPAAAQAQGPRALEVPPTAGWKHAETGLILRSRIAGAQRTMLLDSSGSELDVSAQYGSPDETLSITLSIYRPALASVPVWFDRLETSVLLNDIYGKPKANGDAPIAFAAPGAATASSLRRVYVPSKGFATVAVALVPLGKWLVAIRIGARDLGSAGMEAKLSEVIAGIGWPKDAPESPVAVPVAPCAQPLAYAKGAEMRKPGMEDALVGGAAIALTKPDGPPPVYCRDLPPQSRYSVYRDPGVPNTYLIAVGNSGVIVSIAPDVFAQKPGFRMLAGHLDHYAVYSTFDRLPHPDDAMRAIRGTRPAARVSLDGKTVEIAM